MTKTLLVMGGSHFLGRAVAVEALERGWQVHVFNRGRTGRNPHGVTALRGDRTDPAELRRLASHGPWDAIVDTSGMDADAVDASTRALADVTQRYVYVSTVSVYAQWPMKPLTEDSPTLAAAPAEGVPEDVNVAYGLDKARCETSALRNLGSRLSILRPGVILGPHENIGRLPWWLRRVARGGRILAPGRPAQPIQPVDVRDVAAFACHRAQHADGHEVFNVAAPTGHSTMRDLLLACARATGTSTGQAELEWVDDSFLLSHDVRQWTELPLWRTYPATWQVDGARARAQGLECRPLEQTVTDTWSWMTSGEAVLEHERAARHGISEAKEAALLEEWLRGGPRPH
ncbi:NAD-dependent epimerase/dehydratase family protein [Streptoverticillium reticulum]|uniref:NAD-dependent epimerase/dehydratase family protein n=1 Tax=Streptoverticillium reticulum TaxID=1433415 RepID=UPI0039BF4BB7